ncbi:uncharacterized protein F58A4.6 [Anopheles nili]|uniref:uncharacterized protein F58A4.6 n=1 Tax=Anopheles nili TaxID=185578 RepID=UPI00237B34E5|nr:uncharacterized protein F58A4.6 [Anopheles nili]
MISFYICDYTEKISTCNIHKSGIRIRQIECNSSIQPTNITRISANPIKLVDFLHNLQFYPRFRLKIANALFCEEPNETMYIKLSPPAKEHLDYHWGERAVRMLWEFIELTELMAWLSTLGGAFSALGDYQLACADTAGKISIHQMKLAFRLGDPSLIARCKLYLAISLIQRTEFAAAKQIIQSVYSNEKKQVTPETRLLKMCLGIWAKLRYDYDVHQKHQSRMKT